MTLLSCWILITLLNFDTFLSRNSTGRRYVDGSKFHVELWPRVKIPRWIMTLGQNSTLNRDPYPRSQFNLGSQFNVEPRPGLTIQLGIMTQGHNSTFNLDPDHNSTWNHDPGLQFNVELWPRVTIQRGIMTPDQNFTLNYAPGHSSTLNCDPNTESQMNVESWLGVTIQRWIKTWGHNSTWNKDPGSKFNGVQILSVGGVVIQWPPVSEVAIQHEKSVESWAQPVELRLHGSKFDGVKIQSYTGIENHTTTMHLENI